MKVLSSITDTQDAVNKEYIDGLLADYTKTANLGALASKDSLAFSELTSHPTTLGGYGITDVYSKTDSDGRYFPLAGNKTITGPVRIESGLTVTGTMYLKGGLFDVPAIYGPTESDYKKWCLFYQTGDDTLYIQAGKNSGTSTDPHKGSIAFSGYGGKNATRVDFSADATYFNGSMSCGALTAKSTTINGTLAVNNHTDINSSMAVDAWLTVGTTLTVTGATSLNSTLSVTGTATLGGGAFLPPSKTILFQDAATEIFAISFDSEVGGLNLSGATRTLGLASFQKGIQIEYGQSIAFVDKDGAKQYITLDEENGAIKVIGNFFATGQNAAGGVGEVTGESGGGVANVEIKVNALSAYDGRTITTNAMQTLTGLSVDVAQSMLEGAYNKVIDNSGDYPEVWDYTARGTSTGIIIYLRIGDGYDTNTAYALTYTQSAANWSIIMGEI